MAVKKRYHSKNAWWVSPFNDLPEVRKQTTPGKVQLHDYTLRGWGNGYGMIYDALEARRIVEALAVIGVESVELGLPGGDAPDTPAVRGIVEAFPDMRFAIRVQPNKKEIQSAAECGVKSVLIAVPLGHPRLKYRLGWTWENSLEKTAEATGYARECDLQVTAVPEDIARSNPDELDSYLKALHKQVSPDAFCIEDTTGCALPQAVDYLVRRVRQHLKGTPVHISTANDFGLANACALSGLLAGAQVACGSLNGLGKRLGGAATEELILCLKVLLGASNEYAMENLFEACLLVEEITGIPIREGKPFASHRSYFANNAEENNVAEHPLLTFATDPRLFGRMVQSAPVAKHSKNKFTATSGADPI